MWKSSYTIKNMALDQVEENKGIKYHFFHKQSIMEQIEGPQPIYQVTYTFNILHNVQTEP